VVKTLTQQFGIDPKRLAPQGVGPYAPVAANTTDEGRAKNRRVELVAQP
jgi:outer membrane protein OmpA-like peptidoglycan-associated protein